MTVTEPTIPDVNVVMGWSGVVLPLGRFAGELDRRQFNGPSWPPLPITLADNHWGTELLGPVDAMEVVTRDEARSRLDLSDEEAALLGDENVWASGRFAATDDAEKVAGQLAFWGRLPVSVEVRDGAFVERVTEDPDVDIADDIEDDLFPAIDVETVWSECVIGAVAVERMPAFAGAWIRPDAEAAAFNPVEATTPLETGGADDTDTALSSAVATLRTVADPAVVRAAGAGPVVYPARMFERLELGGPTRLTIRPDGEVVGHVAVWGEAHRADGRWLAAPCGDLSDFLVGATALDDGRVVASGVVVSDGLHAPAHQAGASGDAVRTLIESTATQVATVTAWEDEWGMAVHGSTLPGVSPEQATRAMAGCPSIDQRDFRDGRGFVTCGVLMVNTCGFRPGEAVVEVEEGAAVRRLVASAAPGAGSGPSCSCGGGAPAPGGCSCGTATAGAGSSTPPPPRLAQLDRAWEREALRAAVAGKRRG